MTRILPLILVVATGLTLLALAMDFFVANGFLATLPQPPAYSPGLSLHLWQTYGLDPVYRSRLVKLGAAFLLIASVGVSLTLWFIRKHSDLHGTARFASRAEIDREGLWSSTGILFGKLDKYLLLPGQRHVIAIAPTRSGKTAGIAIPNLLNWSDSVVALDMKLELFARTSGFRAAHGHGVFLFNPFAQDFRTHRWNPLDGVRRGEGGRQSVFTMQDLKGIATVLYPAGDGSDGSAQFFARQAQNLFIGVALLMMESGQPFHLPQILRLRAEPADGGFPGLLQKLLVTSDDLSDECRGSLQQFLGATGDTLSSILATFDAPLDVFRNPLVAAATSASDFKLSDLRRKRMTVYLGITPRDMEQGNVLMTLFVSQTLYQNLDELPESNPQLRYQLLLLLDEFKVLGKMSILVDAAGYLAGYGIRLLTILQSIGQLQPYGDKIAQAFMTNHGCKVVYAPREEADARSISESLGTFTEMSDSFSRNSRGGGFLERSSGGLSSGTSSSAQRRALMLPQEVKLMPFEEEIAFVEGMRPIKARKVLYFEDPVFRERLFPPLMIPALDVQVDRSPPVPTPATQKSHGPPAAPAGSSGDGGGLPISVPERTDGDLLSQHLDGIRMISADPLNPAPPEVKAYVGQFIREMNALNSWS